MKWIRGSRIYRAVDRDSRIEKRSPRFFWLSMSFVSVMCGACIEGNGNLGDDFSSMPIMVELIQPRFEIVTPIIEVFGTVVPMNKADITTIVEGIVEQVYGMVGHHVKAGDVLAQIDTTQLQISRKKLRAQMETAMAHLDLAEHLVYEARKTARTRLLLIEKKRQELRQREIELENIRTQHLHLLQLFKIEGVSNAEVENSKVRLQGAESTFQMTALDLAISRIGFLPEDLVYGGYTIAMEDERLDEALIAINSETASAEFAVREKELDIIRADIEQVDRLIEAATLKSPIGGVIATRGIYVGERLHDSTAAFTIIDNRNLYLECEIGTADILSLSVGNEATLYWETKHERIEHDGTISRVTPFMNSKTGATIIRIKIIDPRPSIRVGMFGNAAIQTGKPYPSLQIPIGAVRNDEIEEKFVFVAREGRLWRTAIETAPFDDEDEYVEIVSGITDDDMVVADIRHDMYDGMRYRRAEADR